MNDLEKEMLLHLERAETEMRYAKWGEYNSEQASRKTTYDDLCALIVRATKEEGAA